MTYEAHIFPSQSLYHRGVRGSYFRNFHLVGFFIQNNAKHILPQESFHEKPSRSGKMIQGLSKRINLEHRCIEKKSRPKSSSKFLKKTFCSHNCVNKNNIRGTYFLKTVALSRQLARKLAYHFWNFLPRWFFYHKKKNYESYFSLEFLPQEFTREIKQDIALKISARNKSSSGFY